MADDVSPPNPEPLPGEHGQNQLAGQPAPAVAVQSEPADSPAVVEPPAQAPREEPAAASEPLPHQEEFQPVAAAQETPTEPPAAPAEPEGEKEPAAEAEAEPEQEAPKPENRKKWYVVKVQSGREDTIKEAIERRVRKEGLEEFFGQIVIPVEKITEIKQDKNGRRVTRTKEKKLYPGYLMVEVEYNDRILYLFRETSGVGDFVGAHPGKLDREPTPMSENEIMRILGPGPKEEAATVPQPPKTLVPGARVRIVDGTFNGMEGIVKNLLEAVGKVQVEVSIFGRPVPVDLDYYQVEEA
jgi:transcriptional antiterminator NusG